MPDSRSIILTRAIAVSPDEALRGFTKETLLQDWLCNVASASPHAGGLVFLGWRQGYTVSGAFTRFDPPNGVEFTWQGTGDPAPTRVSVSAEAKDGGTLLTLVHSGLGSGPAWDALLQRWTADWTESLENLQSVIEAGIDLRQSRRPRLGILIDEFTPQAAEKLGVPVSAGILLGGTMDGSGAQKAGLLKGDVLVSLNGVPLEQIDSFDAALKGLHAGDVPPVEYYRGAEKRTVALELGHFPIPEYPASGPALAEKVRAQTAGILAELRGQVAGLSDTQASRAPAEGEWSVKELVAHMVLMERDYQNWVALMLNDVRIEDWLQMSPNVTPRITALVQRLGSLDALLNELEISSEETAAMLTALPESFVQKRKHFYRRAAGWVLEVVPNHYTEEHKGQFDTAIAAARG